MNFKIAKALLSLLLILCFSAADLQAQPEAEKLLTKEERFERAQIAIAELKGGILIVSLPSRNRKVKELQRLIASNKVSQSAKERMKEQLSQTIEERDHDNRTLVNAFESTYDFSQVYYIYDTSSTLVKKNQQSGYFLNNQLELDPAISLEDRPFYILRSGTTNSATTSGVEALIVMDRNFKDLERPFPYYIRLRKLKHIFAKIFKPKSVQRKNALDLVILLNTNLWEFFNEG